jgi:hypothetical protein
MRNISWVCDMQRVQTLRRTPKMYIGIGAIILILLVLYFLGYLG